MPLSKIARKPIPKFSRSELNKADLCAKALWYGINYQTGKPCRTSDACLMSKFAFNFYHFHTTKKRFTPDIIARNIKELILACGITNLFRWMAHIDLNKGIDSFYTDVYPEFLKAQRGPNGINSCQVSIQCLKNLNVGLVKKAKSNQLNLSSRILFFLSPNLHTFNMNRSVAKFFGLPERPSYHYAEYFELFSRGMVTNQTNLSKYKMPSARDGLDSKTWNEASRTDWWKRRVLDLAVLLYTSPKVTVDPNLRVYTNRKIKQEELEKP